MTEFIFMLTHHDVTIPNAIEVFDGVKDTGLRFVGCKNIGLHEDKMQILFKEMKNAKMTTFLEVVTYDEKEQYEAVNLAAKLDVDYLIGCMPRFAMKVQDYIRRSKLKLKFFPYIGTIVGHPCILEGAIDQIIRNGKEFERNGIEGINLLLYRYTGNVDQLIEKVSDSIRIPIIVAGSIDSFGRIDQVKAKNLWAFTIGGAILEKKFSHIGDVRSQITTVLDYLKK